MEKENESKRVRRRERERGRTEKDRAGIERPFFDTVIYNEILQSQSSLYRKA